MAMAFYDQPRFTKDIDIMVAPDDFQPLADILMTLGYEEKAKPWTFQSTEIVLHRFMKIEGDDYCLIDILVGKEDGHREIVENASSAESEDGEIKVARREDLIWLKEKRDSEQDKLDIRRLRGEKD
ncbi:nucleotidyltransferase family protein [bacterium]|nr:nucleotidyltransferase family protein [bacterium]